MKKIFIFLLAAAVLFASVSLAEELASLSDADLLMLYRQVSEELESRGLSAGAADPDADPAGTLNDTVLYYNLSGGQYYHLDQNCKLVNPKYLPLNGRFTYAQLGEEKYRDLKPCNICGAVFLRESPRLPADFREAVDTAGESASVGGDIDYLAVVAEKNGKYIRMVTLLDDRAKEMYMAGMQAEDNGEAFDAFQAYAWSLPVSYTEEFTVKPKDQAELDAQAGKTVGMLVEEGYLLYGSGGGIGQPTIVDLSYGLYNYAFEVDAAFEEYQEHIDRDDLESLRIKSGKLSGFSAVASIPDYLADGTYAPRVVPNITAEEASAAAAIPPVEEYTEKAWPLTAESYVALLDNVEAGYGQVYMLEGVVHQVLSRSPLTVILNTGEDGKSQPVVVECPKHAGFRLETGSRCRIYADVSSACYLLPVLTARYIFLP